MIIAGFQKLTLIDYPGKLATTVFTVGCSFRCPFCHNPELVLPEMCNLEGAQTKTADFFSFLENRKNKLEGVCITGGEPTVQADIIDFIADIKKMNYLVKLDTNGTRPDVLKKIVDGRMVDFIAMDIKNQLKKYNLATGTNFAQSRIKLSVELIRHSRIPHEFRTTAVPGLHTEEDFLSIGKWLSGSESYWLQRYQEIKILNNNLKKKTKGKKLDLEKIKNNIEKYFGNVGIRG